MFVHQNKNLLYVFKVFTTKIERTFRVAGSQRTGGTLKCIAVRPQDVLLIIFRTELSQVEAVRQTIGLLHARYFMLENGQTYRHTSAHKQSMFIDENNGREMEGMVYVCWSV